MRVEIRADDTAHENAPALVERGVGMLTILRRLLGRWRRRERVEARLAPWRVTRCPAGRCVPVEARVSMLVEGRRAWRDATVCERCGELVEVRA